MQYAIRIFVIAVSLVLASVAGRAEEGGGGHYAPGVAATFIDLLPADPGFILQPIYLHYKGDAGRSRTFPLAGKITSNLKAEVDSVTLGALYTFDGKVLGARYTLGAYAPYLRQEVTGTVTTARRTFRRRDKADGSPCGQKSRSDAGKIFTDQSCQCDQQHDGEQRDSTVWRK